MNGHQESEHQGQVQEGVLHFEEGHFDNGFLENEVGETEHPLFWQFSRGLAHFLTTVFFDLRVYGTEHVPAEGGALIVSNHQSFLDPVVLGVRIGRPLSYIAKSELFEIAAPVTWVLRSLGGFPVRQGAGDVGAVKESIRRLKEGHVLNIFPEGQRTEDGEIGRMEKGVALIVRRARVPVVPAVVVGAYEAWPIGATMFRRWPIRVEFGPPMQLADLRAEEIVGRIDGTLRRMFRELREKCGGYAVAGGM